MPAPPSQPRRFVPTLTQIVEKPRADSPDPLQMGPDMQQELVMRIMQRLDVALEKRLPQAVSKLVAEHLQTLGPRLWEEVATVVAQSVEQAVAQELGQRNKP